MNITQNTLTLLLQVASPFPPKGRVRGGNLEEGGKGKVAFPTPPYPSLWAGEGRGKNPKATPLPLWIIGEGESCLWILGKATPLYNGILSPLG